MSWPRFIADHDLNERIIDGVGRRERLLEFLQLRDVGARDWPDSLVLEYAASHGLVTVSHDVNTSEKRPSNIPAVYWPDTDSLLAGIVSCSPGRAIDCAKSSASAMASGTQQGRRFSRLL